MRVNTKELQTQMSRLAGIVPGTTMLPALGCIHVRGTELRASNLDQDGAASISFDDEPLDVCVPFKRLFAIAKSVDSPEVTLTQNGNRVTVEGGASRFCLAGQSPDEFPLSMPVGGDTTEMPAESLFLGLEGVFRSAKNDDSRPLLNGVFVAFSGLSAAYVATDGRRLSRSGECPEGVSGVVVPRACVSILRNLLPDYETVGITLSDNSVQFSMGSGSGRYKLSSKLISGQYPNWRQVLPGGDYTACSCSRESLKRAVRRVNSIGERDGEGHIRMVFSAGEILLSKITDDGEGSDKVPSEGNADGYIGLNPQYIVDALDGIREESVSIRYRGELEPIEFLGGDAYHLVMPVRAS